MRRYTAKIVMGLLCELLSRPKVSLRSLILRGTLRLNKLCGSARIFTTLCCVLLNIYQCEHHCNFERRQ